MVCGWGLGCDSGQCTCPGDSTNCGSDQDPYCVDLSIDNDNCGECGIACEWGLSCSGGHCVCGQGQTNCGEPEAPECFNLDWDTANCGDCGNECGGDAAVCVWGQCGNIVQNCGNNCDGRCCRVDGNASACFRGDNPPC